MRAALHARHQPVLGNRHEARIENAQLRRARQRAGHQQPEMLGERDRSDQLPAQVAPAHDDQVGIGRADGARSML
jgi:hypothetical protein